MDSHTETKKISQFNTNKAIERTDINSQFVFLYKKTERIVSALYMVTGLFEKDEPLRLSIRHNSNCLIEQCTEMRVSHEPLDARKGKIRNTIADLISYMNIAVAGGLISDMNATIIVRELELLDERISDLEQTVLSPSLLNQSFFDDVRPPAQTLSTSNKKKESHNLSTIRSTSTYDLSKKEGAFSEKNDTNRSNNLRQGPKPAVQAKKSKRQREILKLIKEKGEIGVKDASKVIHNCSEKTLQRELMDLVDEGVLKREGKRRWTKYSFA